MLCDQLSRFPDHLPGIIRSGGAGQELDELLAALGGEDEPDKDQMLAWLNDIEDACASEGLAVGHGQADVGALQTGTRPDAGGRAVPPRRACQAIVAGAAWSCRPRPVGPRVAALVTPELHPAGPFMPGRDPARRRQRG